MGLHYFPLIPGKLSRFQEDMIRNTDFTNIMHGTCVKQQIGFLTGHAGFSSSAGHVGPDVRVGHDISLLIPEIWARLTPQERSPGYLIGNGCLEPLQDFTHDGKAVLASRLGYRITQHFVHRFFGKIFDNPGAVFTDEILRPEIQDLDTFVDGINNIVEAQQRVALQYLEDGSIEDACPPLRALLLVMATGKYEGMDAHHPDFRAMFTREHLLDSDWYRERLQVKQQRDVALWTRHVASLRHFLEDEKYADEAARLGIARRLQVAERTLAQISQPDYLASLVGTLGADPLGPSGKVGAMGMVNWGKARLAPAMHGALDQQDESLQAYRVPTLLQRFASRLRRTRLSPH